MMSAFAVVIEKMRRARLSARLEAERALWERNGADIRSHSVRFRSTLEQHVNDDGSAAIVLRLYKLVDTEAVWVSDKGVRRIGGGQ